MQNPKIKNMRSQNGAFMVLATISMSILITIMGSMFDTAWIYRCKGELQNTADSLAVLGAKRMIADGVDSATYEILGKASEFKIGRKNTSLASTDIRFGHYNAETGEFYESSIDGNSLEIIVRRTVGSPSGPIPLFFMNIFGRKYINMTARAYASSSSLDIMLVTDKSGSMENDTQCAKWEDKSKGKGKNKDDSPKCKTWGPEQPMTDAKNAAINFLDYLRPDFDRAGFISYSDKPSKREKLTDKFHHLVNKINSVNPGGWTNIGGAIEETRKEYKDHGRQISAKIIILLSDGEANCYKKKGSCGSSWYYRTKGNQYAKDQSDKAATEGIIIYSISLGSGVDRTLMKYIAAQTGGHEYYAPSGAELIQVYEEIAKDMPVKLTG